MIRLCFKLKDLRLKQNDTLRKVEQETGVSNAYISQMENGFIAKPSPNALRKLSNYYDVTFTELMQLAGYIEANVCGFLSAGAIIN